MWLLTNKRTKAEYPVDADTLETIKANGNIKKFSVSEVKHTVKKIVPDEIIEKKTKVTKQNTNE